MTYYSDESRSNEPTTLPDVEVLYMNVATGSVDNHDGWWYEDEGGVEVNAVDRGEVVEIESNTQQ